MCGILAVVTKAGEIDLGACRRALSTMHWRGPDFSVSRVWENRLFLGQTVLSITGEPWDGAGQYHRSRSGRFELLYNGEIYNFRELEARFFQARPELAPRYRTDTEVLVNLHEVLSPGDVPALLDGMFAYVGFDAQARQLHVARDMQGEKSLYIYEDAQQVVIASEIRAILALIPGIPLDPQALRDYFRTRHLMLFERTVYQGIRQLLPGRVETLDLDLLKWSEVWRSNLRDWIDPERLRENRRRSVDSLADELESLLVQCVREMIPVGRRYAVVVSGGVDSSLLAHYLLKNGIPQVLVAINHVGKDRISRDLSEFERGLGRAIDTLRVYPATYAAEIPRCQRTCGSPLHSHSFVGQAIQSAFVRAAGCRVLFGGDGADELFGGYEAYLGSHSPNGPFSPSPYTAHQIPLLAFNEDSPTQLQNDLAGAWADALEAYAFIEQPQERAALAMMYCDAAYQLSQVGLRGADLMSMMWSVETRSVYLRRPVVQFALNLPAPMKANPDPMCPPLLRAKPLLKRLFLRHFRASFLSEKQGFAGFPNESAVCLGDPADYRAMAMLNVSHSSVRPALSDAATAWKLVNVEYFLRHCD